MISRISSPKMGVFGFGMAQNGNGSPAPAPVLSPAERVVLPFPGFVPTYPQQFYNYPVLTDVPPATGIPTWAWILGIGAVGVLVGTLVAK